MKEISKIPSKLILFGEHAVLKNQPCIVVSINLFGSLKTSDSETSEISAIDINKNVIPLPKFLKKNSKKSININLDTRIGCGLGSSAVISVLLSRYINENPNQVSQGYVNLIDELNDHKVIMEYNSGSTDKVLNTALKIENIFHGKSSGVDVTASYVTGLLKYQNYRYKKIDTKYLKEYKLMIFDSGITKNTKDIVEFIKIGENTNDYLYIKIGKIANEAEKILSRKFSLSEIYLLIRKNQDLLERLNIVPESMKKEVLRLRTMGIESKITGAGCGGYLYTLVEKDFDLENWKEVEIFDRDCL